MTAVATAPAWHAELPALRTGRPRRVHGCISPIGGPDNAAAQLGLPGIIAKVSGNGLWTEDTVSDMTAGTDRVMHHLGMIAGAMPPAPQTQFVTMWVPAASVSGLWYPAQRLGQAIEAEDVLGEIRDMFGTVQQIVRSDRAGFILYQLSSLIVNSGEALLGVGTAIE